jgi:hypothetical protein
MTCPFLRPGLFMPPWRRTNGDEGEPVKLMVESENGPFPHFFFFSLLLRCVRALMVMNRGPQGSDFGPH